MQEFKNVQGKKYKALNEEIEGLLPGATSAGLATAYKEMKESFSGPIKKASNVFYISIGLLLLASFILTIDSIGGSENFIKFVTFDKWDSVWKGLAYKTPFYIPIIWLAFYSSKRRSEFQRLQQEYAHKEAFAKSYNSYKNQIEELGDEDKIMQKDFIKKAVDAIAYNASETLDGKHGDKMPSQNVMEKLIAAITNFKPLK